MTDELVYDDEFYDLGINNLFSNEDDDIDEGSGADAGAGSSSSADAGSSSGAGAGAGAGSKREDKLRKFNERTTIPKFKRYGKITIPKFERYKKIIYSEIYVLMKHGRVHILQKTLNTGDCIVSPIKQYFSLYEYLNYLSKIRQRIYWGPKNCHSKIINKIFDKKSIFNHECNYYTLIGKYELLAVKKIEDLWIGYTTNYEYIFFEQKFQFDPFINDFYAYFHTDVRLVSKHYKNPTDFNNYFEHLQKELESSY